MPTAYETYLEIINNMAPVTGADSKEATAALVSYGHQNMDSYADMLQQGKIDLGTYEQMMRDEIKNMTNAATAQAMGGWDNVTASQWGYNGYAIKDQYQYLNNFMQDIQADPQTWLTSSALSARADMYANSIRATAAAQLARQAKEDGYQSERRVLGEADHCDDCVAYADEGWVEIGTLPPIGDSQCIVNCQCEFEYSMLPPDQADSEEINPEDEPTIDDELMAELPPDEQDNVAELAADTTVFDMASEDQPAQYPNIDQAVEIYAKVEEDPNYSLTTVEQGVIDQWQEAYMELTNGTGDNFGDYLNAMQQENNDLLAGISSPNEMIVGGLDADQAANLYGKDYMNMEQKDLDGLIAWQDQYQLQLDGGNTTLEFQDWLKAVTENGINPYEEISGAATIAPPPEQEKTLNDLTTTEQTYNGMTASEIQDAFNSNGKSNMSQDEKDAFNQLEEAYKNSPDYNKMDFFAYMQQQADNPSMVEVSGISQVMDNQAAFSEYQNAVANGYGDSYDKWLEKYDTVTTNGEGERFFRPDIEYASYAERGDAKTAVIAEIEKTLGADKADEAQKMLDAWASSASNGQSVITQKAAAELYGGELSGRPLTEYKAGYSDTDYFYGGSTLQEGVDNAKEILEAMQANTAQYLADKGYQPGDTITMYRGSGTDFFKDTSELGTIGGNIIVDAFPLSSWSLDIDTARDFAKYTSGTVLRAEIPIDQIIGSAYTGNGCLTEAEFVVATYMKEIMGQVVTHYGSR